MDIGVDVGGTFTDVVVLVDGTVTTTKVPTTADQSEGVIEGIERACDSVGADPERIDSFRHAMTVATNAMLEGTGAKTALVTTSGFGDVLEIGRQTRPALYDLSAEKPDPLVPSERRHEVDERATESETETELTETDLAMVTERLDEDIESIAVSFLHAYAHPENEQRAAAHFRDQTDANVVASHEILPEFREYERTATTVADAYVTPVISSYLGRLVDETRQRGIATPRVMQSNGGITDSSDLREHAVTSALSGPAAGVVGASLFEPPEMEGIITFDMGGTSTDVGLVRDGDIERTTDASVGGYPVHVPMVAVETVGAGGGSIAWVDEGGALRVGPRSAGAQPGPACYGNGGTEPTVTDGALLLGYLGSGSTLGGSLELDETPARAVFEDLTAEAGLDDPVDAAHGVYRVATERMSQAVRTVTVREGHDPRSFAVVAFGGAGPMHAAALAASLGVDAIRIPRANGVLSALGLLAAPERQDRSLTVREPLDTIDRDTVERHYEQLTSEVRDAVSEPDSARSSRQADLRYEGQSHELTVGIGPQFSRDQATERFHEAHERARGYRLGDEPIEVVTIRVTATVPADEPTISHEGTKSGPKTHRQAYFDGTFQETPVYDRERLPVGTSIEGPAVLEGGESTVVVPPGWECTVDVRGTLEVHR